MSDIFLKIVNMSISAGWAVLIVLLFRLLFRKAPKWVCVLLWGVVALRLICPVTIESVISLIPSSQTVSPEIMSEELPQIDTGIPILNNAINPIFTESFTPDPGASVNPLQVWVPIAGCVWVLGGGLMLSYALGSYLWLGRKLMTAVRFRDNIYQSDRIRAPFVMGFIKPKIYLPFSLPERAMGPVVAHERAHISRGDHIWKILGYVLLAVHWFNPLIWVGYVLLCRDIELACDEKVISSIARPLRADYSQALLDCSAGRWGITSVLGFGEIGVRKRVKWVLTYEAPAAGRVFVVLLTTFCMALCLLTNPPARLLEEMIPEEILPEGVLPEPILPEIQLPGILKPDTEDTEPRPTPHNIGTFVDLNSNRINTYMPPVLSFTDRLDPSMKLHRSNLPERQQQLYDIFLPYVLTYTPFSMANADAHFTLVEMNSAMKAIRMDYPETWLYFYSGADLNTSNMVCSNAEECYEVYRSYYYTLHRTKYGIENFNQNRVREELAKIDKAADEILQAMPKYLSEKGKARYLAEYICEHTEYSAESSGGVFLYDQLNGPLLHGKGTVQAYAFAYQYLCQKAGILCTTSGWNNIVTTQDGEVYYLYLQMADDTGDYDKYLFE